MTNHAPWRRLAILAAILPLGTAALAAPSAPATSAPALAATAAVADYGTPLTSPYPPPGAFPRAGEHPRLLFRSQDIAGIRANMLAPENAAAYAIFNGSGDGGRGKPSVQASGSLGNRIMDLSTIEAWAFDYAIFGDGANGRKAVDAISQWLPTMTFDGFTTISEMMGRYTGWAVFVAAEVYDWCYPLLSDAEKAHLIASIEAIAAGDGPSRPGTDPGYPPSKLAPVTSWASESGLLRDTLSFAVAVYDERPDIYEYTAGRLFAQYREPRNFWYPSNTAHQGDSYGPYRFESDLFAQWIIGTATGAELFDSGQMSQVPYEWIHTRRPDGQLMRTGDSFEEMRIYWDDAYWRGMTRADTMAAGLFGDPVIKAAALRDVAGANPRANYVLPRANELSFAVHQLIVSDPSVAPASTDATRTFASLPLTRYFGSPNGTMTARTGWTIDARNRGTVPDAMAFMKIGELTGANHAHLDSGSFQIYYKGLLTGDTGFYATYGDDHHLNYNKRSVAHNTIAVYDPNEDFGSQANDGGQALPNSFIEAASMNAWQSGAYDRAEVLAQGFDTANATPQYSFVSGDITKSYSGKVTEALRTMAFLPTGDPAHPAAFVVLDKVTASDPNFRKSFLLHYEDADPETDAAAGTSVIVNRKTDTLGVSNNGRLAVSTLLPRPGDIDIANIGGTDTAKRFWVDGANREPPTLFDPVAVIEAGAGRLEISPKTARSTDFFLHFMTVGDADAPAPPVRHQLIETGEVAGVWFAAGSGSGSSGGPCQGPDTAEPPAQVQRSWSPGVQSDPGHRTQGRPLEPSSWRPGDRRGPGGRHTAQRLLHRHRRRDRTCAPPGGAGAGPDAGHRTSGGRSRSSRLQLQDFRVQPACGAGPAALFRSLLLTGSPGLRVHRANADSYPARRSTVHIGDGAGLHRRRQHLLHLQTECRGHRLRRLPHIPHRPVHPGPGLDRGRPRLDARPTATAVCLRGLGRRLAAGGARLLARRQTPLLHAVLMGQRRGGREHLQHRQHHLRHQVRLGLRQTL